MSASPPESARVAAENFFRLHLLGARCSRGGLISTTQADSSVVEKIVRQSYGFSTTLRVPQAVLREWLQGQPAWLPNTAAERICVRSVEDNLYAPTNTVDPNARFVTQTRTAK